jgi:hypothetical protein
MRQLQILKAKLIIVSINGKKIFYDVNHQDGLRTQLNLKICLAIQTALKKSKHDAFACT